MLAPIFGARFTDMCSNAKVEMVRSIGADRVLGCTQEDFAKGERRYDLILDIRGNSSLARLGRTPIPKGTSVIAL